MLAVGHRFTPASWACKKPAPLKWRPPTPIICGCVRSGIGAGSSTDQPVLVHAGEELASASRVVSVIEVAALARDFAFLGG